MVLGTLVISALVLTPIFGIKQVAASVGLSPFVVMTHRTQSITALYTLLTKLRALQQQSLTSGQPDGRELVLLWDEYARIVSELCRLGLALNRPS